MKKILFTQDMEYCYLVNRACSEIFGEEECTYCFDRAMGIQAELMENDICSEDKNLVEERMRILKLLKEFVIGEINGSEFGDELDSVYNFFVDGFFYDIENAYDQLLCLDFEGAAECLHNLESSSDKYLYHYGDSYDISNYIKAEINRLRSAIDNFPRED